MLKLAEVNKGFQALAAEVTDYSKKALDDGMRAWEQLLGVKTVEQAPDYPLQLMLSIYEFPEGRREPDAYPKEFVVDYVRGSRPA